VEEKGRCTGILDVLVGVGGAGAVGSVAGVRADILPLWTVADPVQRPGPDGFAWWAIV